MIRRSQHVGVILAFAATLFLAGCKAGAAADAAALAAPAGTSPGAPLTGAETLADAGARIALKQYGPAMTILRTLTQRGDLKAESALASLYLFGPQETQNVEQGIAMARSAAAQNEPSAETLLGRAYLQGVGVTRDVPTGTSWYMKAAAQDDSSAEAYLGAMYSSDGMVKKDAAQSVKFTAAAAEQGNGIGLFDVAAGFADGSVLPRDPRQAFFWYTVALQRLGENPQLASVAVHGRDKAATQMTLDETRALQIMAQTWVPVKGSLDGIREQAGKSTVGPIPRGTGSGIVIAAGGEVLTARHVIKECHRVTVAPPDGSPVDAVIGATDEDGDLALLKPAHAVGQPAALRADDTVRQGERVLTAGYPISMLLGSALVTSEGTVSSLGGWRANKNGVLFSAAVSPGNSGGPLIGADGAVIGVVEGQLDNLVLSAAAGIIAENVNFASNIQTVRHFLQTNGVTYARAPRSADMSAIELSDRARSFTVLVACEE